MFEGLRLWWAKRKNRRKMDRVFRRREDPFGYRDSPYEKARLDAMERALGERQYRRALEIGCAEGDFTLRLAARAARVTALDVSTLAIERASRRLSTARGVELVAGDLREWTPAEPGYDLIVLADVLYYLDKPGAREAFDGQFRRLAAWLEPEGRIILAHGFAGEAERAHRRSFRERFEALGLLLVEETVIGEGLNGPVACLLSVLERGA